MLYGTTRCAFFGLPPRLPGGVADLNHNRAVVRQPGFTGSMIVGANWRSRRNECAIAKSVIDSKAILFLGREPGPFATVTIREPP